MKNYYTKNAKYHKVTQRKITLCNFVVLCETLWYN